MKMDDLMLLGDRLIVEPDARPTESESGLIVFPETAVRDNPNLFSITGTVRRLGQGVRADEFACLICGYVFYQSSGPRGDCDRCHAAMRGTNVRLRERGQLGPFSVKVGDRVQYGRFAGVQVDLDDNPNIRYLVMHDHELIAADVAGEMRQVWQKPKWNKPSAGLTPTNIPGAP